MGPRQRRTIEGRGCSNVVLFHGLLECTSTCEGLYGLLAESVANAENDLRLSKTVVYCACTAFPGCFLFVSQGLLPLLLLLPHSCAHDLLPHLHRSVDVCLTFQDAASESSILDLVQLNLSRFAALV